MTFDTTTTDTESEETRTRAQLLEAALEQSEQGLWNESLQTNRTMIEMDPNDVSAHNRVGRSLTKLGRLREALDAYRHAVEIDPSNAIALRNSARLRGVLESVDAEVVGESDPVNIRAENFVMETGRADVVELEDLSPPQQIATILPGDSLQLQVDGPYLRLFTRSGDAVGLVPSKTAHRLIELIREGNEYSADVVNASLDIVRVLLREIYRSPETHGRLPFPTLTRLAPENRAALLGSAVSASAGDEIMAETDPDDDTDDSDDPQTEPLTEPDDTDDSED
ncbi:MAG: tetratricopeptide repeat protein [Chloroflexota bacterium]|nr:tetratricopeptide repeat protein [Chloroflexota bacterium]